MYLEYYGLSGFPFLITPDIRFLFESSVHKKAMSHLLFGLDQSEGFIVITGDVGAGKTTILDHLLNTLDTTTFVAAKIVSTHLQGDDMLRAVAGAFRLEFDGSSKASLLNRIERFLNENHSRNLRTLLLVDEAQNITVQALEELRMLSNFQVGSRVPLQSLLLAQPQFRRMLANPDLEQFRQRIIASYHLGPMDAAETGAYIRHRLSVVGWANDPEFAPEAMDDIFAYTGGVPRKINAFCTRLMLFCFLDELHRIDRDVVAAVVDDLRREINQVLEHGDKPGGGGMTSSLTEAESAFVTRLERLERATLRHGRALRVMLSLVDSQLHANQSGPDTDWP
ncbi:XrtA/PEP-CTERM system-associated ATPase [Magnetospirillum molischianum]|uniref:AAA+ ATPase domain-containing protein n=1 Tax=Magnetospirillum molischianum DSM 120 TaxID=1150626 RepID=H8FQB2_MAGML|nr:XrtA/PEP-CTERM system-associated ATPase [Magnetospirillum molischianum]CCG40550.1 hypothetical protein PHAMO_210061 [Magnetospirillum molischianum DSM 120]